MHPNEGRGVPGWRVLGAGVLMGPGSPGTPRVGGDSPTAPTVVPGVPDVAVGLDPGFPWGGSGVPGCRC